jgi:hypothetical protein
MRYFWLITFLVGCASGDKVLDTSQRGDTATETSDTDPGTSVTETEDNSANLSGTITDASGGPVVDAQLRLCIPKGSCRFADTDANGSYAFENVLVTTYAFEVVAGDSNRVTAFVPLTLASDSMRTVDLKVPDLESKHTLTASATEYEVASGLFITAATGDLTPPLMADPAEWMGGARVPEADWPPTDGIDGTVVAMWYLNQFDYHAENGLPYRIVDDLGLADGATHRLYVGSYEEGAWLDLGETTVSGGEITGPMGISLLSTFILVDES